MSHEPHVRVSLHHAINSLFSNIQLHKVLRLVERPCNFAGSQRTHVLDAYQRSNTGARITRKEESDVRKWGFAVGREPIRAVRAYYVYSHTYSYRYSTTYYWGAEKPEIALRVTAVLTIPYLTLKLPDPLWPLWSFPTDQYDTLKWFSTPFRTLPT